MLLEHRRVETAVESTWGTLSVEGRRLCYVLEDGYQSTKVPGRTCIPTGDYRIELRASGGMSGEYLERFGAMHKGMLWLRDVPGFEYVYYHIGNTDRDTRGCPLTGLVRETLPSGEFRVLRSEEAYLRLYAAVVPDLLRGNEVWTSITDLEVWE